LSAYGATHLDTIKGVFAFLFARIGDKGDGWLARKMNQESDAGAIYDTVVDKVGIGLASFYGWKKEVIPRPAIAFIGAKSLASVALTAIMAHNHPNESFRPTTAGKIAMGAESLTFIAYAGAKALEKEKPELILQRKIVQGIGAGAMAATVISSTIALKQYADRAFNNQSSDEFADEVTVSD
jgi:phosphatidylglycerophosphate synthase